MSQTGLIPAWAESIRFEAVQQPSAVPTGGLPVAVGGQNMPLIPLGNDFYGIDASAFAGLVDELRFTVTTNPAGLFILLDAISFSSQAVPEPSALLLAATGVLVLWPCFKRKRA